MLAEPSREGAQELERSMTQLFLLRLNQYAFESKLITEEVYHKINVQLHSADFA